MKIEINIPELETKITELVSKLQETNKKQIVTSSRFITLPDGWVFDKQTGLEWGKSSSDYMNLEKAKKFCEKSGGRLPTIKELQGLVDYTKHDPSIDKEAFPDTKASYYCSGDVTAWNKGAVWCVSFGYGAVSSYYVNFDVSVRPCRASQ